VRSRLLSLSATFAALGLLLALVGPVAAADPTTPTCVGHWPRVVQGVPTKWHAGAAAGDYIWHDSRGWHLRVTHPRVGKVVFAGRIESDQPLTVQAIKLEGVDFVALSADKKTITYRFANYGHIDGLNFQTACASKLTFTGSMQGARLPRWRIWIGLNNVHPLQNPFTVVRVS
jgi:hypothetical protein